jgi:hypothetical protein
MRADPIDALAVARDRRRRAGLGVEPFAERS